MMLLCMRACFRVPQMNRMPTPEDIPPKDLHPDDVAESEVFWVMQVRTNTYTFVLSCVMNVQDCIPLGFQYSSRYD